MQASDDSQPLLPPSSPSILPSLNYYNKENQCPISVKKQKYVKVADSEKCK